MAGKNVTFAPPLPHQTGPDAAAEQVKTFRSQDAVKSRELSKSAARPAASKGAKRSQPATFNLGDDFSHVHESDAAAGLAGFNKADAYAKKLGITKPMVQIKHEEVDLYPTSQATLTAWDKFDSQLKDTFGQNIVAYIEKEQEGGNDTVRQALADMRQQFSQPTAAVDLAKYNLKNVPPNFAKLPLPRAGVLKVEHNDITYLPTSLFASKYLEKTSFDAEKGVLDFHSVPGPDGEAEPLLGSIHLAGNPVAELLRALPQEMTASQGRDIMEFVERFGLAALADADKVISDVNVEDIALTMAMARSGVDVDKT